MEHHKPLKIPVSIETHLKVGGCVEGRGAAEPAGGAAEVGVPGLVDEAGGGGPGPGLPQVVEPIRCPGIQPHTEVVVEQALHLQSSQQQHKHKTSLAIPFTRHA